ncbi:MAG TPA: class I SAM-dependent methyltransferase [Terriglobales bacterium]
MKEQAEEVATVERAAAMPVWEQIWATIDEQCREFSSPAAGNDPLPWLDPFLRNYDWRPYEAADRAGAKTSSRNVSGGTNGTPLRVGNGVGKGHAAEGSRAIEAAIQAAQPAQAARAAVGTVPAHRPGRAKKHSRILRVPVRVWQSVQYGMLRWAYPRDPDHLSGNAYQNRSKMEALLGADVFERLRDKIVIDFGCGYGDQTIEIARRGAKLAIGLDIREEVLGNAREKAVGDPRVVFMTPERCPQRAADYVISLDSFEHFANPAMMLEQMYTLLGPGGVLLSSFGPPWRHPLGGHTFSVFPWAHLLMNQGSLCRWYNRTLNKTNGREIMRFEEVSGGLNRMTIARFRALVAASRFSEASVTPVPIRKLRYFHNPLTREFTTAVMKCELKK